MPPRFGTDGLRGVANVELTPEIALALGRAAARHLPGETFLIGRDTRRSGPMLESALAAGITAEGGNVVLVGVLPTPGLAWLAAQRSAPAAMISASHNPFADNGIKLLSSSGTKLADATERAIEAELASLLDEGSPDGRTPGVGGGAIGQIVADVGAVDPYVDHLVEAVQLTGASKRVVVDCANGAASRFAPEVFGRLGVESVVLSAAPDGTNINAGCGSLYPEAAQAAVLESGADLGLCLDGDADRLIAVDERGEIVDGDRLIALFALDLQRRGELTGDAVVVTVMSNLGLHRALAEARIATIATPVGDRYVTDALTEQDLVLGGEQSGHIVFRRLATTGDGILTGCKLLELLGRHAEPLSALAAGAMTRLPQQLETIPVADPGFLEGAGSVWAEVEAIREELAERGRVLLRPSGTESAVRVMVEAESLAAASQAVERIVAAIERAQPGVTASRGTRVEVLCYSCGKAMVRAGEGYACLTCGVAAESS